METVKDVLEHCKFLVSKGRSMEPAKLFMPKVEAQRRKENKEQARRVVFVVDPQGYSDWHEAKDIWIENSGGNPVIAYQNMCRVLKSVSPETIRAMVEEGQ